MITIQRAAPEEFIPPRSQLKNWASAALSHHNKVNKIALAIADMTIRIVDEAEITALNTRYRHKNKPTNVLSFPFDKDGDDIIDPPDALR